MYILLTQFLYVCLLRIKFGLYLGVEFIIYFIYVKVQNHIKYFIRYRFKQTRFYCFKCSKQIFIVCYTMNYFLMQLLSLIFDRYLHSQNALILYYLHVYQFGYFLLSIQLYFVLFLHIFWSTEFECFLDQQFTLITKIIKFIKNLKIVQNFFLIFCNFSVLFKLKSQLFQRTYIYKLQVELDNFILCS
eukprot:TRINITY_DN10527_c0_g1_i2.p1 TRINITY_DN10527_c0_g1~~TRINITY_DN10527_c0_g1_i2.p1  ORF type:complete len:188 (+),score=-36.18 TRINITY_DN10527_c0_g1_i2:8-571(+)